MPAFGVYPIADALPASHNQISSTYEGRYVTVLAQELLTSDGSGTATKGLPCVFGLTGLQAVGVCMTSGTTTDLISVDTEGIWAQSVVANTDGPVGSAVTPGDQLFINTTTCIISKIRNIATQIPFGYALGDIGAGVTGVIAVKVHFDPTVDSERILYNTVTTGAFGKQTVGILAAGHSEGIAHYFSSQVAGQQDGLLYGIGSWIDLGATFIGTNDPLTPIEGGVYNAAGSDISLTRIIFAGQHQAILDANPAHLYAWRLNVAAAAGNIDALIAAANPQSFGYVASAATAGAKLGGMPLVEQGGVVYWVRLYASAV